ncbi:MAG: Lacal_2735 family protein, partial [Bacteroidota bacterium]|nr:Lacal_2735 family protein [Bacteroidota bacterium]MDX5430009.1 Lacal_2735 family protein [Bacteroidota bacterium]MDX5468782.1 Lacal_2735 family protein [Bacteroidota bacterium]
MFSLFKKKSPIERLQDSYEALMKESYQISHSDRKKADALFAKAEEIAA